MTRKCWREHHSFYVAWSHTDDAAIGEEAGDGRGPGLGVHTGVGNLLAQAMKGAVVGASSKLSTPSWAAASAKKRSRI